MKQGEMVLLNDDGEKTAKDGELINYINCFCCDKVVIARYIFKKQEVVCPHCNGKFTIRYYKNGKVSMRIR